MHIVFNLRLTATHLFRWNPAWLCLLLLGHAFRLGAEPLWNQCPDDRIRSVQFLPQSALWAEPIILLNSNEKLTLSFDDLEPHPRTLEYRILHCDKDWNPSNLTREMYLDGFFTGSFEDVVPSFNTKVRYRNYRLNLPNESTKFKLSGNYCIEVFQPQSPEIVLLRRQFSLCESLTFPDVVLRREGSCLEKQTQQLEIKVPIAPLGIHSVQQELSVRITQNGQWLPEKKPPLLGFIQPGMADYRGIDQACFSGGLEYRNFDITDTRSSSLYVKERIPAANGDTVYLQPASPEGHYSARKDINGGYWVDRVEHSARSRSEADYVWVCFELKCPELPYDIFVMGGFCGWERRGENWMQYDAQTQSYKTGLWLKQAYYNYQFFAYDQNGKRQWNALQPGSSDTENDYGIFVYLSRKGDLYDRLIAYRTFNSALNKP